MPRRTKTRFFDVVNKSHQPNFPDTTRLYLAVSRCALAVPGVNALAVPGVNADSWTDLHGKHNYLHEVALDTHSGDRQSRESSPSTTVELTVVRSGQRRSSFKTEMNSIQEDISPAGKGTRARPKRTQSHTVHAQAQRFLTLNCRTLNNKIQQDALVRLLSHLKCPVAALQETRIRGRPELVITDYVVYTSDADAQGVGGCGIAVHRSLVPNVEEVRPLSNRLLVLKMTSSRNSLWIISAHAPTEAADEEDKDVFFDSLHRELSRIPTQDRVLLGSDTNAHFGKDVAEESPIGRWFYQEEETSDNGHRWLSLLEDHGLILASTLRRPPSRSSLLTWNGSVPLSETEQEKRGMRTLRAQLDYVIMRSSDHGMVRKCRSVPRADFDSDHSPVVITLTSHWKPRPPPRRPPPHDFSLLSHNEDIIHKS